MINNILPSAFKEGQSEIMHKFGIFLIDDMVEYLGYEILQAEWFQFANILAKFSQEKSCVLRQAACYGLGIFAENTPAGVMNAETLQNYLTNLINAAKLPKGAEKEKSYGHCKDNAVAAVGKFIKTHSEAVDIRTYIASWFSFLPLRHDKPEAITQHELLCDIMLNRDTLILGETNESRLQNVVRVLSVLGDLLSNSKIYNDSVKNKIKEYLLKVNNE